MLYILSVNSLLALSIRRLYLFCTHFWCLWLFQVILENLKTSVDQGLWLDPNLLKLYIPSPRKLFMQSVNSLGVLYIPRCLFVAKFLKNWRFGIQTISPTWNIIVIMNIHRVPDYPMRHGLWPDPNLLMLCIPSLSNLFGYSGSSSKKTPRRLQIQMIRHTWDKMIPGFRERCTVYNLIIYIASLRKDFRSTC